MWDKVGETMKKVLRKVGNSVGMTFPAEMLKDMGIAEGDGVIVEYDEFRKEIIIRGEKNTPSTSSLEEKIRSVVEKILLEKGL
jgi:antitoxin component of MazEF toxin-antitoxin module